MPAVPAGQETGARYGGMLARYFGLLRGFVDDDVIDVCCRSMIAGGDLPIAPFAPDVQAVS